MTIYKDDIVYEHINKAVIEAIKEYGYQMSLKKTDFSSDYTPREHAVNVIYGYCMQSDAEEYAIKKLLGVI